MNISGIMSIARKEVRSHFLSPVAVIFLGVFLLITLFSFFTQSRFFIRGIADVRPLFEWMPLLLIFLVAAVTMRQWSEEQKMGTLELLLTLPLRTSELVLGKFVAGMALVSLALALTLPLPLTVSALGPLDSGPVIGGYLASLLLAASYLSIGLCVSAMSDNQIVSLMVTLIVCGLLYFLGSDTLMGFVNQDTGELLSVLGSGSRFVSIERGVLDFRDLFYYLSITGLFLYLNTIAIERKRIERAPTDRPSIWRASLITGLLIALNLIVANIHMHSARPGRIDLTEDQLYSVSDITVETINRLDEKMTITGYFSERTHPLLAPLVPQIKDLLTEYQVRGGERLDVSFIDPHSDEELEEEIGSNFGIKSIPISVADRTEMAFVNAYFHLLLQYGDEYKVLDFEELVDIRRDHSTEGVELKLRAFEYTLTKAIKAVSKEFLGLDALMASQPIQIKAYITQGGQLPGTLAVLPDRLKSIFNALQGRATQNQGTLSYEFVNPDTLPPKELKRLADTYGFMPIQLLDGGIYFLYGEITVGEKSEGLMFLQKDLSEESLQRLIESAIRRGAPGFKKTIGLFTKNETPDHPQLPYGQPPPQPKSDYRQLEQVLSAQYDVKRLDLKDRMVPSDVDILIVGKVGALSENQKFAIDQYLMSGGALIALVGHSEIEPEMAPGARGQVPPTFKAKPLDPTLSDLIKAYGVEVGAGFVADPQNLEIVYPVSLGFNRFQVTQAGYPYFNQITSDDFSAEEHVALSGLNSLSALWPAPISVNIKDQDIRVKTLLQSSKESWVDTTQNLSPNVQRGAASTGRQTLAVTLEGSLRSAFASTPQEASSTPSSEVNPQEKSDPKKASLAQKGGAPGADVGASLKDELSKTGRVLTRAVSGAKLVVVSSPELVSDLGLGVGNYYSGIFGLRGDYASNLLFAQNLVEWGVADDSLALIRNAGASSRIIKSLSKEEQRRYELMNYAIALIALIALALLAILPRRMSRASIDA